VRSETGQRFRGDATLIRSGRGLEALRRATYVSNDIALHLAEADAHPGAGWAELSSNTHTRLTVVLAAIGGRVEHRLKRDRPAANGPFTMSLAPAGAQVWGYTDGLRRVRAMRFDLDPARVSEMISQKLVVPDRPRLLRDERLRHHAECLAAECEDPAPLSSLYIDSMTVALCIDLLRLGPEQSRIATGGLAPSQLRRVTEYLTENLSDVVRLNDLAQLTGLSQSQFGRAFKASTGLTPHRWQLDTRITKAQQMLLSSSMTNAEIALATGFAEQSHFCRVFKKLVGTSPAAWQREQLRPRGDHAGSRR
jgi:AraC-like DNA-binding protein